MTMAWGSADIPKKQNGQFKRKLSFHGHLICETDSFEKTDFLINNAGPFKYPNRKKIRLDFYLTCKTESSAN